MNLFADQTLVDEVKKDFNDWYAAGCPDGDPNVVAICKLLNNIPGVGSRFSCESHPPIKRQFYVQLVVTSCGYQECMSLYGTVRSQLIDKFGTGSGVAGFKLQISTSMNFNDSWIPTVLFEHTLSVDTKDVFLGIMLETLTYMSEYRRLS